MMAVTTRPVAVILVHRSSVDLASLNDALCMAGLKGQDIAFVHNPPTPDTPPLRLPDARNVGLRAPMNTGYGAGMNLGIRHWLKFSDADPILLMTPDLDIDARHLSLLLAKCAGVSVAAPCLVTSAGGVFSAGGILDAEGGHAHRSVLPPTECAPADWVDGSILRVTREAFLSAGLFEERFFLYCEDIEWCRRVVGTGGSVAVLPAITINHESGASRRPGPFRYLSTRNDLEVRRLLGGRRWVVHGLHSVAQQLLVDARFIFGSASGVAARGRHLVTAYCALRGVIDFALRRFGAVPWDIPLSGDLRTRPSMRVRS